ncbi:MAG TPA: methyltransferase [Gemmataceae bacterium]|nr:methyltransferase [Gemmataceae bacterium]
MIWNSLAEIIRKRVKPPLAIVLGSPHEVVELLGLLQVGDATCYQMDLYQAKRVREELAQERLDAKVATLADLWDLPADFQTALFPTSEGSERALKIDMAEQAFHILRPHGLFLVLSPYDKDQLFPALLKKVYGRVHATVNEATAFWCHRDGERPRRRHEVTFRARVGAGPALLFLSRPGVFSYGRLDDGARALLETMHIGAGERILDMGCGCGTNGIFAARQAGSGGNGALVDSNVRAVALADHNARLNALETFQTVASSDMRELPAGSFDVVLANPPYYAQGSIARFFVEKAKELLGPGGRIYLVTRQADEVGPLMAEHFGRTDVVERRGYNVLAAQVRERGGRADD